MKKLLAILFFSVVAALMVYGGGSSDTSTQTGEPVVIDYAFWGNPVAIGVERDIIDAYHASQDRVRVAPVVSGWGDYHTMLLTQMAGGSGPDVMRVDSYYFGEFFVHCPIDCINHTHSPWFEQISP